MTDKEAIDYNKNLKEYMKITDKTSEYKFLQENYEALDIAIKALEQEPCEDCISRKALQEWIKDRTFGDVVVASKHNFDCLPSVTPQPKIGQWIRKLIRNEHGGCIGAKMLCSECGEDNRHDEYMKFCPNCGIKMQW